MKIKTIARPIDDATRPSKKDVVRLQKNPDPKLHPFEKAREYVRALTAAKLDRMFAKPFVAALSEHSDGVYCSATSPKSLVAFLSGAADGEVILWDLATHKKLWSVYAHSGFVRGLAVSSDGDSFFSCGDDRTIKQWRMASQEKLASEDSMLGKRLRDDGNGSSSSSRRDDSGVKPLSSWSGKHAFTYLDHDYSQPRFATSSIVVDVWDYHRSDPVHTYEWGADTVTTVRFNPAEPGLMASTGADRSICLYDLRTDTPLRKVSALLLIVRHNTTARRVWRIQRQRDCYGLVWVGDAIPPCGCLCTATSCVIASIPSHVLVFFFFFYVFVRWTFLPHSIVHPSSP